MPCTRSYTVRGTIMQDDDILNRFDLTHVAVSLVENVLRMRRER